MDFQMNAAIQVLQRTPDVLSAMLRGLDEEWTHTNEGGDTWTAYDIIGHYIHGEKTDWITRTRILLSDAEQKAFTPFDRFAQFNNSKGQSLEALLDEFKLLRQQNLEELNKVTFTEQLLDRTAIHPKFGTVTLRQLLAAWVVHDLTHIYQVTRVMAKQYDAAVGPWKEFLGVLNDR